MEKFLKKNWWKYLSVFLILYSIIWGLIGNIPHLPILEETIRNLYFHVSMWFVMIFLFILSLIYAIKYLNTNKLKYENLSFLFSKNGLFFGLLGIVTGMVWARGTWGTWWVNDTKLNGSLIALLCYSAYYIFRNSINNKNKNQRFSASYNIFAFAMMISFILIIPRLTDSLHPGSGGNPSFAVYDLDNNMRMVFYPSVLGWILFSLWFVSLEFRMGKLKGK